MIFLIDTIGDETGMHLYDKTFFDKCESVGQRVGIVSNFDNKALAFKLHNYYHGNVVAKISYLIIDWMRLLFFVRKNRDSIFIYQSFGLRLIDMFFFMTLLMCSNKYLLVHDLYELSANNKKDNLKRIKKYFYKQIVDNFICHSNFVAKELNVICGNREKNIIYFPHFDYTYSSNYDEQSIVDEVKSAIMPDKINLLFFGQVSLTKGIDILLDAAPMINERFNLIVAGMDKGHLLDKVNGGDNVRLINRYIKDDELIYLFSNIQMAVLPYREIFQSGVLETIVHFQRYAIMSPVAAFDEFHSTYPSFGMVYKENTPECLAESVNSLACVPSVSYSDEDVKRYKNNHDINQLLIKMGLK